MISSSIYNKKDYQDQLFDIVNNLTSRLIAHKRIFGNASNDEYLSEIYDLAQKWHNMFLESCTQGGF